jgi:hypothetical protein
MRNRIYYLIISLALFLVAGVFPDTHICKTFLPLQK